MYNDQMKININKGEDKKDGIIITPLYKNTRENNFMYVLIQDKNKQNQKLNGNTK